MIMYGNFFKNLYRGKRHSSVAPLKKDETVYRNSASVFGSEMATEEAGFLLILLV